MNDVSGIPPGPSLPVGAAAALAGRTGGPLRAQPVDEGHGGGRRYLIRLSAPAEVEAVLAACRQAGCEIEDLEVGRADLEDVFLKLMSDGHERKAA